MADRGMLIELCVDNPRITQVAPLSYDTPIGGDTALVAPSGGEFADVVAMAREALHARTGVELPLMDDEALFAAETLRAHLIAIGHAAGNRLLRRIDYLGFLNDEDYPHEGLQVTSIHSPLGDGHNVLAALGATPEVAAASVRRLVDLVVERDGGWVLPGRVQEIEPEPKTADRERLLAEATDVTADSLGRPGHFRECLRWLRRTGDEAWARAFIETLAPYADGSIPLSIARMSAVDFWTDELVRLWDACETFPFFSDEERLTATNFVVACGQYCHDSITYQKWRIVEEEHQIFNHHTFPAVGLAFTVMYLRRRGYDLPELADWADKSRRTFARAAEAGRSFDEGGAGYSWLVPSHLMRARFAAGDLSWAQSRKLMHCADLAIMVQNNHFETVPYGDCGGYHATGTGAAEVLLRAAEFHGDAGCRWVAEKHGERRTDHDIFARDLPAAPPERHVGLFVLPLDPVIHRWAGLPRFPGYPPPPVVPNVPADECFDKLTFRGGWDPDDDYLLLQGFGDGQHGHPDANAISQYQANGRLFLVDNDYISRWPRNHNMVQVLRAGRHGDIPTTARLDATYEFEGGAATQTSLIDYNGCDWRRTMVWLRNDCVLVIDGLRAREAGEYELRCWWRTLGEAELTEQGMHAEHDGEHFRVIELSDSERRMDTEGVPVNNTDYPKYHFGDGAPKVLCETQRVVLGAGDEACFVNLIVAGGDARHAPRAIAWAAPGVVAVTGGPALVVDAEGVVIGDTQVVAFEDALSCLAAEPKPAPVPQTAPGASARMAWQTDLPAPATCLSAGPGGALVGCEDGSFGLVERDGVLRLLGKSDERIDDILAGRIFGEDGPSILVGGHDCMVHWLAADGTERMSVKMPRGTHMPPWATCLDLADLDGDGRLWPIAGTAAWQVVAITPEGRMRWIFDTAAHTLTDVAAADLNGDGRDEVAAATVYYCVPAITADGGRLWEDEDYNDFWNAGPIFPVVHVADVDGDGEMEVVTAGSDALVHCIDCRGFKKWTCSIGDEAAGLEVTDAGIAVASLTGELHLIDGAGQPIWRARLGSRCCSLAAVEGGFVVGVEDGRLLWLDSQGTITSGIALDAPCEHLLAAGDGVIAATADGHMLRVEP